MIDPSYVSAIAAVVGTIAGCTSSIAASWVAAHSQTRAQSTEKFKSQLRDLYEKFIVEASLVYAHALENNSTETSRLVAVYATLNKIRVISSPVVIEEADKGLRKIVATYSEKNKTFLDIAHSLDEGYSDPLHEFTKACHEELRAL